MLLLFLENVVVEQMKMTSLTTTCQIRDSLIFFFYAIVYGDSSLFCHHQVSNQQHKCKAAEKVSYNFFYLLESCWRVLFCNLSGFIIHSGQMELEINSIFLSSLQKLHSTYLPTNPANYLLII